MKTTLLLKNLGQLKSENRIQINLKSNNIRIESNLSKREDYYESKTKSNKMAISLKDIRKLRKTKDTRLLSEIANFIDDYELSKPESIAEKLIDQPDSKARCRLAETRYTPKSFLEKLTKEADIDVAQSTKISLEEFEK